MHIYLRHFLHGSKVATCEQEAQYDEKHGWVRYDPEAERNKTPSDVVPLNALSMKKKQKEG